MSTTLPRAGLYGKVPAEGDFVSRRLPWDFIAAWDAWLQAGVAASRERLGARWLEAYLTAPLWRFQLRAGLAGAQAWLGLCFPSVDRVGRHFPFTVAVPLPGSAGEAPLLVEADAVLRELEELALQALDPQLPLAQLEARLAAAQLDTLVLPAAPPAPVQPLRSQRFAPEATAQGVRAACAGAVPGAACFFTWGSDVLPPTLLNLQTLPPPSFAAALLVPDAGSVAGTLTSEEGIAGA